jgi:hypothetical protein
MLIIFRTSFRNSKPMVSTQSGMKSIPCETMQLLIRVSVYFFWSYHSASKDVFDFETSGKNVQKLFDYAKQLGLYVIARAGPYCNAETSAGGLALWTSDGSGGNLRTSDQTYYQAWLPWVTKMGEIIAANQITNGGVSSNIKNHLP